MAQDQQQIDRLAEKVEKIWGENRHCRSHDEQLTEAQGQLALLWKELTVLKGRIVELEAYRDAKTLR